MWWKPVWQLQWPLASHMALGRNIEHCSFSSQGSSILFAAVEKSYRLMTSLKQVFLWLGFRLGLIPYWKRGRNKENAKCEGTFTLFSRLMQVLFVDKVFRNTAYTGCPRRNVPDFGRVFLMLKYTDITQNTHVQSWTVTEIMAREKCGHSDGSTHCTCQLTSLIDVCPWGWCPMAEIPLTLAYSRLIPECTVSHVTSVLAFMCHV